MKNQIKKYIVLSFLLMAATVPATKASSSNRSDEFSSKDKSVVKWDVSLEDNMVPFGTRPRPAREEHLS